MNAAKLTQGPPIDLATLAVAAALAECGALRGRVPIEATTLAEGLGLSARTVKLRLRALVFLRIVKAHRFGRRIEVEITAAGAALLSAMVDPLVTLSVPRMRAARSPA